MSETQSEPTVTLNGEEIAVKLLPDDVKNLIEVYKSWETDLLTERKAVFKTEAALRGLGIEIEKRVAAFKTSQSDPKGPEQTSDYSTTY